MAEPDQAPKQLTLGGLEQTLEGVGMSVDELPEGFGKLNRKQTLFVVNLLRCGNITQAATEAGYSAESAHAIGSELLKNPKVFAVYRKCLGTLANSGEVMVRRVYERAAMWHARCLEAIHAADEADEMVKVARRDGIKDGSIDYESRREICKRDAVKYAAQARADDSLLATLIGKLGININVTEGEKANKAVLTPELTAQLVAARRRVMAAAAQNHGSASN